MYIYIAQSREHLYCAQSKEWTDYRVKCPYSVDDISDYYQATIL